MESPEVIKDQRSINVIIFFRKLVVVSATRIARRRQRVPINSF